MATFGYTTIGGSGHSSSSDGSNASRAVLTEDGDVSKLTAYISSGAADIKGLIYSDSSALPSALIAVSNSATATLFGEWLDLTFSSPVSLAAGTYWLAVVGTSIFGSYQWFFDSSSGDKIDYDNASSYSSPEDPWSGGSAVDDLVMSLYATYTASGGGGGFFSRVYYDLGSHSVRNV